MYGRRGRRDVSSRKGKGRGQGFREKRGVEGQDKEAGRRDRCGRMKWIG